jgi:hypothetical protein
MPLDRKAPDDAAKGRALLVEALAMYESLGMPFHAKRASKRLRLCKLVSAAPGGDWLRDRGR